MSVTICACMIVKNESKIIERVLKSILPVVDMLVIHDTGSTDDTKEKVASFCQANNLRFKLSVNPWVDFSYNRNAVLKDARSQKCTYVLIIDADNVLKTEPDFDKQKLKSDVYMLKFRSSEKKVGYFYHREYLLKSKLDCQWIGRTHEYISFKQTCARNPIDSIWVHDYQDGGSKSDKYERDIIFLKKDIEEAVNLDRSYFYLAQSYFYLKRYPEAIKNYRIRLKEEWRGKYYQEEEYYSYYRIVQCYLELGKVESAHTWAVESARFTHRSEALYTLGDHYASRKEYDKAYEILKMAVERPLKDSATLFVNKQIHLIYLPVQFCKVCMKLGKTEEAYQSLLFAVDHTEEYPSFWNELISLAKQMRNEDRIPIMLKSNNKFLQTKVSCLRNIEAYFLDSGIPLDETLVKSNSKLLEDQVELLCRTSKIDPLNALYSQIKFLRVKGRNSEAKQLIDQWERMNPKPNIQLTYLMDFERFIIFWNGDRHNEGLEAGWRCLKTMPSDTIDYQSVVNQIWFYIKPLSLPTMLLTTKGSSEILLGNYLPSNPSVIPWKDGYLCNLRLVNYFYRGSNKYISSNLKDPKIRTRNIIQYYDKDLKLVLERELPKPEIETHHIVGYEDVRLFVKEDGLYFVATEGAESLKLMMGKIVTAEGDAFLPSSEGIPPLKVNRITFLTLPEFDKSSGSVLQKNWIPIPYKNKQVFIYSFYPLVIVNDKSQLIAKFPSNPILRGTRGNTNGLEYQGKTLFLVHKVGNRYSDGKVFEGRIYYSLFVEIDNWKITRVSKFFVFEHFGLEFPLSLFWHQDKIAISFGYADCSARISFITKERLEELLEG